MITGFHHFEITTADADRQAAFYGEHFGMRLVSDREIAPGGFTEKVTGVAGRPRPDRPPPGVGLNFELLEYREPGGDERAREPNHAGSAHLCFVTDDIEADYDRLRAKGVTFRSPGPVKVVGGPNDGGKALYLEDPDGNAVELVELARPWPGAEG